MSFGQASFYSPPSFGGPPSHNTGPTYRPNHPFTPVPNEIDGYQTQWHQSNADMGDTGFHFNSSISTGSTMQSGFSNHSFGGTDLTRNSWSNLHFANNKLRPQHRFSGAYRGGAYRGINKSNPEDAKKDTKEKDKRGPELKPVGIASMSIDFDPPVQGCEIKPYVMLKCENGQQAVVEHENACHYRWFKGQKRICDYPDCSKAAELQCLVSVKVGLPTSMSYFCSPNHFRHAWKHFHAKRISDRIKELDMKNDGNPLWLPWDHNDGEIDDFSSEKTSSTTLENKKDDESKKALYRRFPPVLSNSWTKVSEEGTYTPKLNDIGCMLLLEVQPNLETKNGSSNKKKTGQCMRKDTKPVLERPPPPPKRRNIATDKPNANDIPFSVMTYNILAQLYTNNQIYHYCPLYALNWTYRKHNLLREILTLRADIICLQEVQNDHFEDFFLPSLSEEGYDGIFKAKTRGDYPNPKDAEVTPLDGCAIFYKKDRFALMEQYHVEFNEAAKHMFKPFKSPQFHNSHNSNRQKYQWQMKRLLKGNIALVLVLEEIPPPDASRRRGRRGKRRLCVANTHIYWHPEYADIKLWQTWVLCQELSKLVSQRELPLILAGDFNSQPKSAVYHLLSSQHLLHDNYEAFKKDKLTLLPVHTQISHELQLTSAYSFMGEPQYTNYTGHFIGILDYIWYTKATVGCLGVMDVGSPEEIAGPGQDFLPSTQRPSDHLSLYSTFVFL